MLKIRKRPESFLSNFQIVSLLFFSQLKIKLLKKKCPKRERVYQKAQNLVKYSCQVKRNEVLLCIRCLSLSILKEESWLKSRNLNRITFKESCNFLSFYVFTHTHKYRYDDKNAKIEFIWGNIFPTFSILVEQSIFYNIYIWTFKFPWIFIIHLSFVIGSNLKHFLSLNSFFHFFLLNWKAISFFIKYLLLTFSFFLQIHWWKLIE